MSIATDVRKIRWGVLGTGSVAASFARGLAFVDGAQLAAVGSRARPSAESFAARFGATHAYDDYRRLLADPTIDVVYVATPNETHEHLALSALEAGKAVLCEKPFALDAEQGRAIVEASRRRSLFCAEAMWMRFSPAFREALRVAGNGAVGDIRMVSAQLGFPNTVDPGNRMFKPPGGGALLDLGVYPLSLAQAVFGSPVRVSSAAVVGITGVDEQVTAILDYSDGGQALIAASLRTQLSNSATLFGTSGLLDIGPPLVFPNRYRITKTKVLAARRRVPAGRWAQARAGHWVGSVLQHPHVRAIADHRPRSRSRSLVLRERGNGYSTEAAEVVRCLRAGLLESPSMALDDTLAVLESMDAVRRQWAPAP